MTARQAARGMAECCRQLAQRGLIAGRDGNLSVRLGPDRVLVTPSGIIKSGVRAGGMVVVDLAGKRRSGGRNPTSELDLHLRILRRRSDVGAVVHAHPPAATAFAVAGLDLTSFALAELILLVGPVPLVPYAMPGSPELGARVEGFIERHDALLLANHGAVTVGRTLDEAWIRMESLEHAARILTAARQLGRVNELEPEAVERLMRMREQRGGGRDV